MGLPPKGLRLPALQLSCGILRIYGASSQRSFCNLLDLDSTGNKEYQSRLQFLRRLLWGKSKRCYIPRCSCPCCSRCGRTRCSSPCCCCSRGVDRYRYPGSPCRYPGVCGCWIWYRSQILPLFTCSLTRPSRRYLDYDVEIPLFLWL